MSDNLPFTEDEIRLGEYLLPVFEREFDEYPNEEQYYETMECTFDIITQEEGLVDKTIEYIKEHPNTNIVELTSWLMQYITPLQVASSDEEYERLTGQKVSDFK